MRLYALGACWTIFRLLTEKTRFEFVRMPLNARSIFCSFSIKLNT